jgi:hypothetical protein
MTGSKSLIYPIVFMLVLAPVLIVALITYDPGGESCECAARPGVHTHGVVLASAVQGNMQLIFNVSPAAQLYQAVDGQLELCGGDISDTALKHVTVDVNDARLALGERLPVSVEITIRRQDTGEIVVQAGAPATYSPGHGYHFGDNLRVPNGAAYDWEVIVSPVMVTRLEGAQDLWLEPVTWTGSFAINAEGRIVGKAASLQKIGEFTAGGMHITVSQEEAHTLYEPQADGTVIAVDPPPGSRYFVVDVTDHTVNYEEKLPGATVNLTLKQADVTLITTLAPTISPVYGFHYGANVALGAGEWTMIVEVAGLDFLRHAGPAVTGLTRQPVSHTFVLAES